MKDPLAALILALAFLTSTQAASQLRLPDPVLPVPKTNVERAEIPLQARLYMGRYVRTYIEQFMVLNSVKENLFDEAEIVRQIHHDIDRLTPEQLMDPKVVKNSVEKLKKNLGEISKRLYGKALANPTGFTGGSRVDALEQKIDRMSASLARVDTLVRDHEALSQRLQAVEQRGGGARPKEIVTTAAPDSKLVYVALLMALGSFFLQLYRRR